MAKPVVGIIGNHYLINDEYPAQAAGRMNVEAVATVVGALPVIVPAMPEAVDIDDLVEVCAGFVFTGARPNVHPEEYGQAATDAHGVFDRDRDGVALPLIRAAVARGVPILGICRGFQEFNVAFGGTLYPEIRDLAGRMNHRMPPDGTMEEKFALRHSVTFTPGGVFQQVFGSDEVMVNTLHGQGIDQAGDRVVVEGYAPDGTAEAIYIKDAPGFALAVQWHPEWRADEDPTSKALFSVFGDAVRGYAAGARLAAE